MTSRSTPQKLTPRIQRGRVLRRKLLRVVQALAGFDLVPQATVDHVVKGSGSIDTARDLLALAKVFRDDAAKLSGKHPVDEATLSEAEQLGSALLQALRPAAGKRFAKPNAIVRDRMVERLYTPLSRAYGEVERATGALWGLDAGKHVPTAPPQARRRDAGRGAAGLSAGGGGQREAEAARRPPRSSGCLCWSGWGPQSGRAQGVAARRGVDACGGLWERRACTSGRCTSDI